MLSHMNPYSWLSKFEPQPFWGFNTRAGKRMSKKRPRVRCRRLAALLGHSRSVAVAVVVYDCLNEQGSMCVCERGCDYTAGSMSMFVQRTAWSMGQRGLNGASRGESKAVLEDDGEGCVVGVGTEQHLTHVE